MKCGVVFCPATVYQERNIQDLVTNLEKEVIGYRNTDAFIRGEYILPTNVQFAYDTYTNYMK